MQLMGLLSAEAVSPFMTEVSRTTGPNWGVPGDYFLWDQAD
ncbi:hypothetical protein KIPB_014964, partial [Kipferlia bialata]|eukprot:g14964.t1